MAHIDYYLSVGSAYVYLVGSRVEVIAARHRAILTYKPLDSTALFAQTGGLPNHLRHANRRAYRAQEMRRQAKKAGLPLNLRPAFFPVDGAPASYAVIAAQNLRGDVSGLIHALGRALWVEERNIADEEVIRDCLGIAGFEPTLVYKGIESAVDTYRKNLDAAVAAGVFGVPFFITSEDERFWGQDRLDDLDAHLAGRL